MSKNAGSNGWVFSDVTSVVVEMFIPTFCAPGMDIVDFSKRRGWADLTEFAWIIMFCAQGLLVWPGADGIVGIASFVGHDILSGGGANQTSSVIDCEKDGQSPVPCSEMVMVSTA